MRLIELHPKETPDRRFAINPLEVLVVREHPSGTVVDFNLRHTAADSGGVPVDVEPYWIRFTESYDDIITKINQQLATIGGK